MVEGKECLGWFMVGAGIGAFIMAYIDYKLTVCLINKFYDEQQAIIHKFYGEMKEQSDKFFSIMKTYIQKEDA